MDEQATEQAFITALMTQHYDLRSAASATIAESSSRASLYLFSLSSALVALGFTVQRPAAFNLFAAAALPSLVVLGLFTFRRIVDTGLENLIALRSIVRIREFYATLTPDAARYFDIETAGHDTAAAKVERAADNPWIGLLFTSGTMIATINSIVAGVGLTMVLNAALGPSHLALSVAAATTIAVGLVAAAIRYQRMRFLTVFTSSVKV